MAKIYKSNTSLDVIDRTEWKDTALGPKAHQDVAYSFAHELYWFCTPGYTKEPADYWARKISARSAETDM